MFITQWKIRRILTRKRIVSFVGGEMEWFHPDYPIRAAIRNIALLTDSVNGKKKILVLQIDTGESVELNLDMIERRNRFSLNSRKHGIKGESLLMVVTGVRTASSEKVELLVNAGQTLILMAPSTPLLVLPTLDSFREP